MISLRQSIINEASKTDLCGVYPIPPKTLPSNSAFITLLDYVSQKVNKHSSNTKYRTLYHYAYQSAWRGNRYKIVSVKNQPNSKVDCLGIEEVPQNFFFIGTTNNELLGRGGQIKIDKILSDDNVVCGHYNVKRKEICYIDCKQFKEVSSLDIARYGINTMYEKYNKLDKVFKLYQSNIDNKSVIDVLNNETDDDYTGTTERIFYWNIIFYGSGAPQSAEMFYDSLAK